MANLQDFKARLEQVRTALIAELPRIAETVTITAKALAERRMKSEGFGVLYSNNRVPAWFLHGKELNLRGTKYLEDHGVHPATGAQGEPKKQRRKKGEPAKVLDKTVNWKEFRGVQGLQAEFVDLSYSNKMWANMAPVRVEKEGAIVRAFLGATNIEAQDKMNWNRDRYGDFIRRTLNDADGKILNELVISEVSTFLIQYKI